MAHRNIPVFVPHMGCPHQCVFCDQKTISGCKKFRPEAVREQIEAALDGKFSGGTTEIAFFGGSFTGIEQGLMIRLLDIAAEYAAAGRVDAIRLSTRPDFISEEILNILAAYPVKTVELGIQSMDDRVLLASQRGHTAEQSVKACRMVKEAGFALVGQMMIGLPGADAESELRTAEILCRERADAVRIYPTVVFAGTVLERMTREGIYRPLEIPEAVARTAEVLKIFQSADVPCLRIGLCATEDLTSPEKAVAGPRHPALGELVMSEIYYEKIKECLRRKSLTGRRVILSVPEKEISRAVGQHRSNLTRLQTEDGTLVMKINGNAEDRIDAFPWTE